MYVLTYNLKFLLKPTSYLSNKKTINKFSALVYTKITYLSNLRSGLLSKFIVCTKIFNFSSKYLMGRRVYAFACKVVYTLEIIVYLVY